MLRAGLAVAPGAFVAAVVAGGSGRPPTVRAPGVRRAGALSGPRAYPWYARGRHQPDFLGEWLPGKVMLGIGVGATLPIVASAALAAVPGGLYATASSVVTSSRQVGGVLGIAVLVMILGGATGATVADLRAGWWMCVACFVATAAIALLLGRAQPAAEIEMDPGVAHIDVHEPAVTPPSSGRRPSARCPSSARCRPSCELPSSMPRAPFRCRPAGGCSGRATWPPTASSW